jgi:hypothetical protein
VSLTFLPLFSREIAPGNDWTGGWVVPRVSLDLIGKRKIFPCLESNPGRPACSPLLYRLSYPGSRDNILPYIFSEDRSEVSKFNQDIFYCKRLE